MLKLIIYEFMLIPLILILNWNLILYFLMLSFLINILLISDLFFHYNLGYGLGTDILSFGLNSLTIWISFLMMISSKSIFMLNFYYKEFLFYVLMLLIILILSFSVINLFYFYIYFESSLIPTLILILGWGYQVERLDAGMYMFLYTLFGSLPLLMSLFNLKLNLNSLNFYLLKIYNLNMYMYMCLIIAFYIKLPVIFFHFWLPKAHVEAPVSGSMILAGVLLKLGGYGILRISSLLLLMNQNFYLINMFMVGILFISIMILKQMDLKSFVAYSSVVHMGLMIVSQMTGYNLCINSMLIYMLAHGLCSSALFSLVNINFERLNSRSMKINKGLMNIMPSMMLFWFFFSIFNMAAPPSLNLWGELGFYMGLVNWGGMLMVMELFMLAFFSGLYSIYLFSRTQHGNYYIYLLGFNSGLLIEYYLLFLHLIPLFFLMLNLNLFMIWI